MTLRGHFRNGTVVFDDPPALAEGVAVEVELRTLEDESVPTLYDRYRGIIGIAKGLPRDLSENHDHYLYGTPKRGEK